MPGIYRNVGLGVSGGIDVSATARRSSVQTSYTQNASLGLYRAQQRQHVVVVAGPGSGLVL